MKQHTIYTACLSLALMLLAACNKDKNDFFYKGDNLPFSIRGYNGSNEKLNVKLDTSTIKEAIGDNTSFEISDAFTFFGNNNKVKLSISEAGTGKLVLEKELKKEDGPAKLSLFYMDGIVSDFPEKPTVENGKLKITYMFLPVATNYTEPVDIAFTKYYWTPQVFEEMARIKNLKPYEFSQPITFPTFSTGRQEYNGALTIVTFQVRIYKAGTNELYTEGSDYTWHPTLSSPPKPTASVANSKLYIFMESPDDNTMTFYTKLDQ